MEALAPHMEAFLEMMTHEDLDVKKAALLMVNAAVHHQVKSKTQHFELYRVDTRAVAPRRGRSSYSGALAKAVLGFGCCVVTV